jgi:hypothetical protein
MEEKVENRSKIYLFVKTCVASLLIGIALRVLIAIIIQSSDITSLSDILDPTLLIPYGLFVLFLTYRVFIKKEDI